ncbi:MAG: hypothetical protein GXP41_00060 [Chloroflexi bacterium]|nr:hypothetical protein [Chloroflexota bacterium]
MSTPIEVVRTQALNLRSGKWEPNEKIFVQVYGELATSGLLADLHGNELKILLALALHARPLGRDMADGGAARPVIEEFRRKGLLGAQDAGYLCCSLAHAELMRLTGLAENTVAKYAKSLVQRGLIEKRTIQRGSRVRNLYFILPATHIDKFNTYHPRPGSPSTASNFEAVTAATPNKFAASHRRYNPVVDDVVPARENFDQQALLTHFAARKGTRSYRATAHDRKRLAELQDKQYSQAEIIAAIDRAFDERPADAPPIRQFAYCARIALSQPPRATVTATAEDTALPATGSSAPTAGAMHRTEDFSTAGNSSPPASAVDAPPVTPRAGTPSVLDRVVQLHQQELGPVTPLLWQELERLVQHYPDRAQWERAFRKAAMASVRRLDYVAGVLKNSQTPNPTIGGKTEHERTKQQAGTHRRKRKKTTRKHSGWTAEELADAQKRGEAVPPLDVGEVLGSDDG